MAQLNTDHKLCAAVAEGGKIYALGGTGSALEEFDPRSGRWTVLTNMVTEREFFGAAVLGGRVYAIAGRTREVAPIERYDPAADRWERFESMTEKRNRFGCAVLGDCVYLIGGERGGKDWRRDATCYRPLVG